MKKLIIISGLPQMVLNMGRNNNLRTLRKQESHEELQKARFFAICRNSQTKPRLDFSISYYYLR